MRVNAAFPQSPLNRFLWKSAGVALVLGTLAFVAFRAGLGLVCLGTATFFIVASIAWLLASFIRHPVCQRWTWRTIAASLVAIILGFTCYVTSARVLFRTHVAKPIPPSVQILESLSLGGLDPSCYLHFRLDPKDFDVILRARPYKDSPNKMRTLPMVPWWKPESMTNPTVYYWNGGGVWLIVNETRTEAYFAFFTS